MFDIPILRRMQDAVAQADAEGAARNAAALALARFASHTGVPSIGARGTSRLYVWRTKKGNFALYYDGTPHVVELVPHVAGTPVGDIFVPGAGANNPPLTSVPVLEIPMARRNPDGPAFASLERAVKGAASEQAQVNVIVRALAGMGMRDAEDPEVHTTSVDRSTYRVYIWRDTPFGDAVVLGTGPSFNPEVRLGAQIPSVPGVGVYIRAKLDTKKPRTLAGASRAASRVRESERGSASRAADRETRAAVRAATPRAPRASRAATTFKLTVHPGFKGHGRDEAAADALVAAPIGTVVQLSRHNGPDQLTFEKIGEAGSRDTNVWYNAKTGSVASNDLGDFTVTRVGTGVTYHRAPAPSSFARPTASRRTVSGGEYVSLAAERASREAPARAASEKQELLGGLGNLLDKLKAMKR